MSWATEIIKGFAQFKAVQALFSFKFGWVTMRHPVHTLIRLEAPLRLSSWSWLWRLVALEEEFKAKSSESKERGAVRGSLAVVVGLIERRARADDE